MSVAMRLTLLYIVSRMFITFILLVLSGYAKRNLMYDAAFFGVTGTAVMMPCIVLLCFIMKMFGMNWKEGLRYCIIASLAVYFLMNIIIFLYFKNDYFLLAMFYGFKNEALIVILLFIIYMFIKWMMNICIK